MYRIAAALIVACIATPVVADYNAGLAAYKSKNYLAALKQFKSAAESGDPKAHYRAGQMYYRGQGSVQDYALALRHFENAAQSHLAEAQYMVAFMHENKQGVRRTNPTMAFNLYRKAAKNNHDKAQFRLATLYAEGIVVPENLPKAYEYYEAAAQRGNVRAQYEVGRMYDIGLDQTVCNAARSLQRCRRGLAKNFAADLNDHEIAAQFYRKAAEKNYAPAQFRLGEFYDLGRGVKRDVDTAQIWYAKAAEQGMVEARHKLAGARKQGNNAAKVDANNEKVRQADLRMARKGNIEAQIRVAKTYDKGIGVPKDYVRAYAWYNVAAAAGSPSARASRDAIAVVLTSQQISEGQKLAREISRGIVAN